MSPEIKAQWLEALRSGEYKQGTGYLHRGDEFCCLGVLCDLAEKAGVVKSGPSEAFTDQTVYDREVSSLPRSVRLWSGINTPMAMVGDIENDDGLWIGDDLAMANDSGYSFRMIADLIEERL